MTANQLSFSGLTPCGVFLSFYKLCVYIQEYKENFSREATSEKERNRSRKSTIMPSFISLAISRGKQNQWSVPAILLFTKNADYENEKCLKIKVFICILHSKQKKDTLFLTSTRRYENLRKVSPFLIKSGTFLGFVFDIK